MLKFGGTSVATPERARGCASPRSRRARGGLCDRGGRFGDGPSARAVRDRSLLELVGGAPERRNADLLLAAGELIAAAVFADELARAGIAAVALSGAQAGIVTDERYGDATICASNRTRVRELLERGVVPVVAGFQGATEDGAITTLGRGGTDLSAIAHRARAGAERVDIYTDVSGAMTADPRRVPEARTIERASLDEMTELAEHGAKVMHHKAAEYAGRTGTRYAIKGLHTDRGTVVDERVTISQRAGDRRHVIGTAHVGAHHSRRHRIAVAPHADRARDVPPRGRCRDFDRSGDDQSSRRRVRGRGRSRRRAAAAARRFESRRARARRLLRSFRSSAAACATRPASCRESSRRSRAPTSKSFTAPTATSRSRCSCRRTDVDACRTRGARTVPTRRRGGGIMNALGADPDGDGHAVRRTRRARSCAKRSVSRAGWSTAATMGWWWPDRPARAKRSTTRERVDAVERGERRRRRTTRSSSPTPARTRRANRSRAVEARRPPAPTRSWRSFPTTTSRRRAACCDTSARSPKRRVCRSSSTTSRGAPPRTCCRKRCFELAQRHAQRRRRERVERRPQTDRHDLCAGARRISTSGRRRSSVLAVLGARCRRRRRRRVASLLAANTAGCSTRIEPATSTRRRRFTRSLLPLIDALFATTSPIPVKWAMRQLGFRVGECRLPLDAMPARARGYVCCR